MTTRSKMKWFIAAMLLLAAMFTAAVWGFYAYALRMKVVGAQTFRIGGGTMSPLLLPGDRVAVTGWPDGTPRRWDIVVFERPDTASVPRSVHRVVGLPGERVDIQDGKIFVNGKPLELPPDMRHVSYVGAGDTPIAPGMVYGILEDEKHSVVPEDCYFLLGDNSASSRDGRFCGWVPRRYIYGRVASIWWPPSRARVLE